MSSREVNATKRKQNEEKKKKKDGYALVKINQSKRTEKKSRHT
jgi:hypothetical protein